MTATLIQWLLAHPLLTTVFLTGMLPLLPLLLFRKSLQRGPLPHEVGMVHIPAMAAFKAGLKKIHFSDARIQRDHESKLVRLLEAGHKQGTVTPSEESAGVKA